MRIWWNGRHAGFRFQSERVQVQLLLCAPSGYMFDVIIHIAIFFDTANIQLFCLKIVLLQKKLCQKLCQSRLYKLLYNLSIFSLLKL